jgi:excisionase family DNA binding protein
MNYISTGKAAQLLSVTPDTVLKWIKAGKIAARRTAGGHYRIARQSVDSLLAEEKVAPNATSVESTQPLVPCWEYHAIDGKIKEECFACLVFKVRGSRCYEIGSVLREKGSGATCCSTPCEECAYFKARSQQPVNVLVFTNDDSIKQSLTSDSGGSRLRIKFTSCEYDCSLLVDAFRPECVVVDCVNGGTDFEELCKHLTNDPRIAGVRILLAMEESEKYDGDLSTMENIAIISHPFTMNDLEIFVENFDLLGRAEARLREKSAQ